MKKGFSLVELSIVLVILGLLTGGILTGQSLIRASELRAVSTEYQRYRAATNTFRDKYFATPGDFNAATRFWGRLNNNADCVTNSSAAVATPGACDGNGDGVINVPAAASQSGDMFQFWRQLANAGLIEGTYTGLAGAGAAQEVIAATNAPTSRLGSALWSTGAWTTVGADPNSFSSPNGAMGNIYVFGADGTAQPVNAVLKAEEAWNIDTKMDDGRPGIGAIQSYINTARPNCATTDVATTAVYALSSTAVGCNLFFKMH